jgi:hypothetical protein
MQGQERQQQIENASEALAARLETIRARSSRILQPLPTNIVAKGILDSLYAEKGKKESSKVLFSSETIQDMRPLQLLIAMNLLLSTDSGARSRLQAALGTRPLGTPERPAPTLLTTLREAVQTINRGEPNISIPFATAAIPITNSQLVTILQEARTGNLQREVSAALKRYPGPADESGSAALAAVPLPGSPMAEALEPPRIRVPAGTTDPTPSRSHAFDTASDYRNIAAIKDNLRTLGARSTFRTREEGIRLLNLERRKDGLPPLK